MELLLVIVIIAVITTIATPRYMSSLQNYRVKTAAQRVVTDLEYARNKAKSISASCTVRFSDIGEEYSIVGEVALNDPNSSYVVRLNDPPYLSTIRSLDLGGDGEIIFNGFGYPDADGVIILRSGSKQLAVEINAATGAITIERVDQAKVLALAAKGLVVAID